MGSATKQKGAPKTFIRTPIKGTKVHDHGFKR